MAFVYADRVMESSSAVGTGAFSLSGAVAGFQDFATGIGNTNETYYVITHDTDNTWEVGQGTVGLGTLSRDSVFASSNGGALVNFAAGAKTVFATSPATFYSNALSISDHAAVDHTGFTGVPAAEAFTSLAHDAVDHTGFTGVNSFDSATHDAVDHTGFTGVNSFDSAAHLATDHTGFTGVGLTTRRDLVLPKSIVRGEWAPEVSGAPAAADLLVPAVGPYPKPTLVVAPATSAIGQDDDGHYASYSAPGGGGDFRLEFPSSAVTFRSVWQPRVVVKQKLLATGLGVNSDIFYIWVGDDSGTFQNGVQFSYAVNPLVDTFSYPWSFYRVVGGSPVGGASPGVDMGFTPANYSTMIDDVFYFVVDYTSPTDMTVSVLDSGYITLYTASFTGAPNVPAFTTGHVDIRLYRNAGGAADKTQIGLLGVSLSYGAL